jgi:hypothetical protein
MIEYIFACSLFPFHIFIGLFVIFSKGLFRRISFISRMELFTCIVFLIAEFLDEYYQEWVQIDYSHFITFLNDKNVLFAPQY